MNMKINFQIKMEKKNLRNISGLCVVIIVFAFLGGVFYLSPVHIAKTRPTSQSMCIFSRTGITLCQHHIRNRHVGFFLSSCESPLSVSFKQF